MNGSAASALAPSSSPVHEGKQQNAKAFVFLAAVAIAGCGESPAGISSTKALPGASECCGIAERQYTDRYRELAAQEREDAHRVRYRALLQAHRGGSQLALRVRVDTARNRLWVLSLNDLYVYDIAKRHLIRRIALSGWSVTDFICLPDIALGLSGSAIVSDNAQARLWQIDADSFRVTEHVIRLLNKEHWDIGFGGLAFAPDGRLFGAAASGGSVWAIDVVHGHAHQVELDGSALDACALTATQQP